MTKFMQPSFSVYNNFRNEPKCDNCGDKSNVYYQSVYGRVCVKCYQIRKQNELKKLLDEQQTKS
jgi:hypothetical protein